MISSTDPIFQSLLLVMWFLFCLLVQHYASPYLPRPNIPGANHELDPLNKMEFFTLISIIAILTNGVLLTNANDGFVALQAKYTTGNYTLPSSSSLPIDEIKYNRFQTQTG